MYGGITTALKDELTAKLRGHARKFHKMAFQNVKSSCYKRHPELFEHLANAIKTGKSARIIFTRFKHPLSTIEKSILDAFESKSNRYLCSGQNGYPAVCFKNRINYNAITQVLLDNLQNIVRIYPNVIQKPIRTRKHGYKRANHILGAALTAAGTFCPAAKSDFFSSPKNMQENTFWPQQLKHIFCGCR